MKITLSIAVAILTFLPYNLANANTGVFFGAGNQVIPIKDNRIQLVKETVNIKLSIEDNGNYGVPFIPWANVEAHFQLKNTTSEAVNMQMGFPFLDLHGFGDEEYVLSNLKFKVLSDNQDIKTELKEGLIEKEFDPEGSFKKVFAWNDSFKPNQIKQVVVTYRMLMGIAGANTGFRGKYEALNRFFPALTYMFSYITKTAYTWKGPIDEAVFRVDCSEFFTKLDKVDFTDAFAPDKDYTPQRLTFLESFSPSTYQKHNGVYVWNFKDKVPDEGLLINFIVLRIPSTPKDLKPFVKHIESKLKDRISIQEVLPILESYYKILSSGKQPGEPFNKDCFEEIPFLKDKTELIFGQDKENIEKVINEFKALMAQ